jgi:hypothetical protein
MELVEVLISLKKNQKNLWGTFLSNTSISLHIMKKSLFPKELEVLILEDLEAILILVEEAGMLLLQKILIQLIEQIQNRLMQEVVEPSSQTTTVRKPTLHSFQTKNLKSPNNLK